MQRHVTALAVAVVMVACGSAAKPVAQHHTPTPSVSLAPSLVPSTAPCSPASPSPGAVELKFVMCIQPVPYPAAPVTQAIVRTNLHVTPTDRGSLAAATSARLSQTVQRGAVTSYVVYGGNTPGGGPYDLVLGPDGLIWFEDEYGGVGSLSPDGTVVYYTLTGLNDAGVTNAGAAHTRQGALAFGPDGNLWFSLNAFVGNQVGQVYVGRLTPSGSYSQFAIHRTTGVPLALQSQFMAMGPDGAMWLTDDMTDQVVRVAPDGSETDYQLPAHDSPTFIAGGPDGAVWFITTDGVGRLTPDGSYYRISVPSIASSASNSGGSSGDVAFASDGSLWITVTRCLGSPGPEFPGCEGISSGELEHWTVTGHLIESIPLELEPRWMYVGADGTVWFSGLRQIVGSNHGVGMLGDYKSGSLEFFTAAGAIFLVGPIVATRGSVWYSDCCGQVTRYTP